MRVRAELIKLTVFVLVSALGLGLVFVSLPQAGSRRADVPTAVHRRQRPEDGQWCVRGGAVGQVQDSRSGEQL